MAYLYESQVELYAAMETLYTNMKKDGKERKAIINYFTRKLEILESYWSEYQGNHEQLIALEDQSLPYFQEKLWENAGTLYQKIKDYIIQSINKFDQDQQTPGTSKEYRPPSSKDEQPHEPLQKAVDISGENQKLVREKGKVPTVTSFQSRGSTSKSDDMLHMQNINFKAFMRTIKGINLEEISEKWEFEDVLSQLQERWKVIDTQHWKIQAEQGEENIEYENKFTYHENMYNRIKKNINSKLWSVSHREKSTPKVDIPIFTGNYHQWVSFKDLFKEAIHSNPALSKAQKMQFLKSKVKGEAERLIQHLPISSINYDTCWEILNHRYENKKLIFTSHINILLNIPTSNYQSLVHIRKMHDVTLETLNAIKNLEVDISTWDPIIVHILSQKLDAESYSEYLDSLKNSRELPILEDFMSYLESKFTALEQGRKPNNIQQKPYNSQQHEHNVNTRRSTHYHNNYHQNNPSKPFMKALHISSQASATNKCPLCNLDHGLFYCKKFLSMTNDEKLSMITKHRICKNCLHPHFGKPCISTKKCRICTFGTHNTLLHDAFSKQPTYNKTMKPQNVSHVSQKDIAQILLSTAVVKVKAHDGSFIKMRALIDQGSQISLITEHAAQTLGIKRRHFQGMFFGVGENGNNCKGMLTINCQSIHDKFSFNTDVFITNKLIKNLPNISFEKPAWNYIQNINLADPEFYNSRPVDLLFGADIYSTIMLGGIIRGNDQSLPLAQQTQLGWLLCGNMKSYHCNVVLSNIENIQKFWEVEDINESSNLSEEDQKCINYYIKTTKRTEDGRYQVEFPFKKNFEEALGKSKEIAIAQFRTIESKLSKNPTLSADYKSFINEYIALRHMIPAKSSSNSDCYLPHLSVYRADSATTKVRIVFNASSKTSSSVSLNDVMYKGPNLQQDLQSLLLKWRQYRYAYTADIEKMYRQVLISEDHQKYQKIVWRDSVTKPIQDYQLTTITYGTKAAP
ncbi:jg280, partial [Pararge aegeria aegeria]